MMSRKMRHMAATALGLLLCCGLIGQAQPDLYVAPGGHDSWSGRLPSPNAQGTDGPLATVAAAQPWIRTKRQKQADRERAWIVALRGGTYRLSETLTFTPEDAGTEMAPVIYQAYNNERPIISGGREITGWRTDGDGRWFAELPDVREGRWTFTARHGLHLHAGHLPRNNNS